MRLVKILIRQADLNMRWANMPEGTFSHVAAQIYDHKYVFWNIIYFRFLCSEQLVFVFLSASRTFEKKSFCFVVEGSYIHYAILSKLSSYSETQTYVVGTH